MNRFRTLSCSLGLVTLFVSGCDEKKEPTTTTSTPSAVSGSSGVTPTTSASAPAKTAAKESTPAAGSARFLVAVAKGTFLIDAPLEKIKGVSDEGRGNIDVNAKELAKSRGEIMIRVSTLKTNTFNDMDKDSAQTEHARNWMEVGLESAADARMKYEWATLTITSVEPASPSLAEVKEETGGARVLKAKVSGDFTLHGVTSKKTAIPVTATFKGPADAPTELVIKTTEPMPVSLKEHDIKPRDKVGSFLNGALDRIGKKIDDKVQVSFEATAKGSMPAHPSLPAGLMRSLWTARRTHEGKIRAPLGGSKAAQVLRRVTSIVINHPVSAQHH